MIRKLLIPAVAALTVSGCVTTMAPEYQRPDLPVTTDWPTVPGKPVKDGQGVSAATLPWHDLIADGRLRQVVQMALDNNRDLRVAGLNIEKARAQYHIQRAEIIPSVAVSGSQTAEHTPASVSYTGQTVVSHTYEANIGISNYELDLFGRLRSLNEEALQTYLSTDAAALSTRISLIAQVAGSYLTLAADEQQLKLAQDTLGSRQSDFDLQKLKLDNGQATELELSQAETELESARATSLQLKGQVANDRNALTLLVGAPVPEGLQPKPGQLQGVLAMTDLQPGLPSDLLLNRPDIVSAERTLKAANANIGAARAAFFPSISLTATAGRASDQLDQLFDNGNRAWSFIPQINIPIFEGGALKAQLESAKVEQKIAVADYERAIQSAFSEVADALADRSVLDGQLHAQQRRSTAAQAAYDLTRLRYDNGVENYQDVLTAQRTLFSAQQDLITVELEREANLLTLYKALGGGLGKSAAQTSAADIQKTDDKAVTPAPAPPVAATPG